MVTVILWLIAGYLGLTSIYLLIFAFASFFAKQKIISSAQKENRFLILLPVYKEDAVVLESARKALLLEYNKKNFQVLVIADSLQALTLQQLGTMGCQVVVMDLLPRSKAKAINLALSSISGQEYDIVLVLDADNNLSPDALVQINATFNSGANAIQCQRVAKEISTPVSILDAISEGINNTIFRKGHRALGLSSALAGSGMAFEYALLKRVMQKIEATNGFDKDLEFEIISSGTKIEYLETVHVFDEKVSTLEVLKNQRTRWFAAQIINIRKGFYFFFKKPSIDLLDKWWQMWIPSRLLLMGFMGFMSMVALLLRIPVLTQTFILSLLLTALALIIATPRKYACKNLRVIFIHLPSAFLTLITSLISINKASKGFIHTPHSSSTNQHQ